MNALDNNGSKGPVVVKTLHWHANAVASLKFFENTPYLLSAGSEAVVVQWHLDKQDRTFISRLGSRISALSLSQRYGIKTSSFFSAILSDNTLKVVRLDNNKTVLSATKPLFQHGLVQCVDKSLIACDGTRLQFLDLDSEYQSSHQFETKPRNFVATDNSSSLARIVSFTMVGQNLVTIERLADSRTEIEVASLKFWRKASDAIDF